MTKQRKTPTSDIWNAVDHQRANNVQKILWKQSFEGVKAALLFIGFVIVTTKEELDAMEIPINNGITSYGRRKVLVTRDGVLSPPTMIQHMLAGNSKLKTIQERKASDAKRGLKQRSAQPKGVAIANNKESSAVDKMDELINIGQSLHRIHLMECRLGDIAYCLLNDDHDAQVFFADQVKTSNVQNNGRLIFHHGIGILTVEDMLIILRNGFSLTCIGINKEDEVDVVWLFYGEEAIDTLTAFSGGQYFSPRLHLKYKSNNAFTTAHNRSIFRFEKSESERLYNRKMEIFHVGRKHTLRFLNEDDSQIPCEGHRKEHKSFDATRTACESLGYTIERTHDDSYTSVDFRVNGVRVQDKISRKLEFNMRSDYGIPFNPDNIDVLQITSLETNIVYCIPFRVIDTDGVTIKSMFSAEELMKRTIYMSVAWRKKYAAFLCNFNKKEDCQKYVELCNKSMLPQISDKEFYTTMIRDNEVKFFGSRKKKLTERA